MVYVCVWVTPVAIAEPSPKFHEKVNPETLVVEKLTTLPAQGFVVETVKTGLGGSGLTVTVIDLVATKELVNKALPIRV